ncbi:MAG: UvrD-helicase domain-containing protein [Polyangiaceae bacterium]
MSVDPSAALNPPQAEAVRHESGPLLVFAGAGSGKTRVITYRIANLLAEHRVAPYRILAVTFTNKAAGELRSRLCSLAGEEVTRDIWAGTFHSLCAKLLRRYHEAAGLSPKFVIYDDTDQRAVMTRLLKEMDIDEKRLPPRYALSLIHAEKREGRLPDDRQLGLDPVMTDVYVGYQNAMRTAAALDFEDLILEAMRLAENESSEVGKALRERFDHVLVDEFQDTNQTQYRLVKALSAATRNLCVVGDDDQSIYRWRGADVRLIRGFRRDFPDAKVVKLEQNYRSSANIVAAALGVIAPAYQREPKKLWTKAEAGQRVRLLAVRDERDEAARVTRIVREQTDAGVSAKDIAVFYRVHAQSRVLEEALRAANIPYQIIGGMKFFDRAEIKDVLAYLRLVDNPRSDADLLRIINVPARGIGQKTISSLLDLAAGSTVSVYRALELALEQGDLPRGAEGKLRSFYEMMEELRRLGEQSSPHALAEAVLAATGYRDRLRDADTAESDARLENIAELLGSIADYEETADTIGETPSLSGYLERVALVTNVDGMQDAPAVNLMTVHAAKGLEFPVVMLTGMEEEVFPYRGMDGAEPEELDEERRLAYVAITRAKQWLYVSYASMRTLFGQTRYLAPSRFLSDIPDEVVTHVGAGALSSRSSGRLASSRATSYGSSASYQRPALRPGERVVDHDAFDDLPSDEQLPTPGARVRHRRFGEGVVEEVEGGATPTVTARFPEGVKRIRAEFLEFF